MTKTKAKATLTDKGRATAAVIKEYNKRHYGENNTEVTGTPWYYCYMDSYNDELCEIAREIRD